LLPFELVRGSAVVQTVSFAGPVNTALRVRVTQAMTQRVAWLRAGAWEIYDLALSIKRVGDRALKMGNGDMALAKWDDSSVFEQTAFEQNHMMSGIDDDLYKARNRLRCVVATDCARLVISDLMLQSTGKRDFNMVVETTPCIKNCEGLDTASKYIPDTVYARYYYLLGIAELGLSHPLRAGKAFTKANKLVADTKHKGGCQLAKAWPTLADGVRQNQFASLLATIPKKPLTVPNMQPYRVAVVAPEIWVMRELGLTGPIPYEDKIKGAIELCLTNKPHPRAKPGPMGMRTASIGYVKPEVLRTHVEKFRKIMALPKARGKLVCWVMLSKDEIGDESVMDDTGQAAVIERMVKEMRKNTGR
jgi:hypothetical protein